MQGETFHVRVSQGRRVVLPVEACERLRIEVGDMLIVKVEEDGVELQSPGSVVASFRHRLNEKLVQKPAWWTICSPVTVSNPTRQPCAAGCSDCQRFAHADLWPRFSLYFVLGRFASS